MIAAVFEKYGSPGVLELKEVAKLTVKDDEDNTTKIGLSQKRSL